MVDEAYKAWRDSLATNENLEATSEKLFSLLRKYARAIVFNTLNRHDPELEQDIVTAAFFKAKTFQGTSNFGTWFYRLAYNQCMDDYRKKRIRNEVFIEDLLGEPQAPDKSPGRFVQLFAGLRESLPWEDVKLIDLRLKGWELKEIAEQRDIPYKQMLKEWMAVKYRVKKALGDSE